jgi:hypothetical protein
MPARADDLADASIYAASLGTLSGTTRPTSTQGTGIWEDAAAQVDSDLVAARLSPTQSAGTTAYENALRMERLLTSAGLLEARIGIGSDAARAAAEPLRSAYQQARQWLIENGLALVEAGEATGLSTVQTVARSYLYDDANPVLDLTPGQGVIPYGDPRPKSPARRW